MDYSERVENMYSRSACKHTSRSWAPKIMWNGCILL